jgi:hypothetical protein
LASRPSERRNRTHAQSIPLPQPQEDAMPRFAVYVAAAALAAGLAQPAVAQLDIQQFLQGLTTGNPREDDALRNAFERGYERGRRDEAQRQRAIREQRRDDRAAQREWEREDAWREDRGGNRR